MTEISETVGCFYEGNPVPIGTIATALGISVNELVIRVSEERRAGTAQYRLVIRRIVPGLATLAKGPASMAFVYGIPTEKDKRDLEATKARLKAEENQQKPIS